MAGVIWKISDFHGCLPGNDSEQAVAESAYTQAKLGGAPTWARLPKEQWPEAWRGMNDSAR